MKYEEENKEFLKKISDVTGVEDITVENMARFGDNVNVQYFHNLLLPELKEHYKKLEKIFERTVRKKKFSFDFKIKSSIVISQEKHGAK